MKLKLLSSAIIAVALGGTTGTVLAGHEAGGRAAMQSSQSAQQQPQPSSPRSSQPQPDTRTADRSRAPSTLSPHHETGQPNKECEEGQAPGQSSTAPGSAFNEDGTAGEHYAGEQAQNSRNTASRSQYDVACTHQR